MKTYQHGLIVGKFMPLHNGHCHLIESAFAQSERITICLMSRRDEPIPGEVRLSWLEKTFSHHPVTFRHHINELPQDASGFDHWDDYLTSLRTVCTDTYDAVFSSELYGERLAQDINATHIMVDQARHTVPVSGSAIRHNPIAFKDALPPVVYTYLCNVPSTDSGKDKTQR